MYTEAQLQQARSPAGFTRPDGKCRTSDPRSSTTQTHKYANVASSVRMTTAVSHTVK